MTSINKRDGHGAHKAQRRADNHGVGNVKHGKPAAKIETPTPPSTQTTQTTQTTTTTQTTQTTTTTQTPTNVDEARAKIGTKAVVTKEAHATHAGDTALKSSAGMAKLDVKSTAEVHKAAQVTGWNFDWDDNIFYMPTKIHLFPKDGKGEVKDVSTADFALIREQVGKEGPYKDYMMKTPESLADFGDDPTGKKNHFVDDVEKALKSSSTAWRGPSFDAFVKACSKKETAEQTTIITARLHSPETIYAGLVALQKLGMIEHLPKLENIFPVSSPALTARLGGTATNPSAAKTLVMGEVLDKIQARGLGEGAKKVMDPEGKETRPMHLWGFSDDDYGNFSKAVTALSEEMKKGRWPDVKITVIFTGKNHPTEKPHAVVLQGDGTTRPYSKGELPEVNRLLGPSARRLAAANATD